MHAWTTLPGNRILLAVGLSHSPPYNCDLFSQKWLAAAAYIKKDKAGRGAISLCKPCSQREGGLGQKQPPATIWVTPGPLAGHKGWPCFIIMLSIHQGRVSPGTCSHPPLCKWLLSPGQGRRVGLPITMLPIHRGSGAWGHATIYNCAHDSQALSRVGRLALPCTHFVHGDSVSPRTG